MSHHYYRYASPLLIETWGFGVSDNLKDMVHTPERPAQRWTYEGKMAYWQDCVAAAEAVDADGNKLSKIRSYVTGDGVHTFVHWDNNGLVWHVMSVRSNPAHHDCEFWLSEDPFYSPCGTFYETYLTPTSEGAKWLCGVHVDTVLTAMEGGSEQCVFCGRPAHLDLCDGDG